MPAYPRPDDKLKKIAFEIIGKPQNMQSKRTEKQKKIDAALTIQQVDLIK